MSKIDSDIKDAMHNPKPEVEQLPCAWEVRVRRIHQKKTTWKRYSIYETLWRAQYTAKIIDGQPIEAKIVPLYAGVEVD